jgi:Fe2+ or Zn2+ uptake regulation protein
VRIGNRKTGGGPMDSVTILKNYGLKVTKPRAAILDILSRSDHGLDAESIRDEAELSDLFINLSTVYRTLELLGSLGVIEKFDLGEKKYNYVLRKATHIHSLTCEICNKTVDLDCPMIKIEELISKETGFSIMEHHLELKGICRECSQKLSDRKDD